MDRAIRTSGKAVVFRGNCVLAVKLHDADGDFYILPGGGQTPGELLPDTVRREVAEETGVSVSVEDVVFVIEGSKGEAHHRVDIVFRCEYLGEVAAQIHPDANQVGFEWLPVDDLNHRPLYPSRLRRPIMALYAGERAPIYLGNECVGDPEITD